MRRIRICRLSHRLKTIAPAQPPPTRPNSMATATLAGARFVTASPATIPAATGSSCSGRLSPVMCGTQSGAGNRGAFTEGLAGKTAAISRTGCAAPARAASDETLWAGAVETPSGNGRATGSNGNDSNAGWSTRPGSSVAGVASGTAVSNGAGTAGSFTDGTSVAAGAGSGARVESVGGATTTGGSVVGGSVGAGATIAGVGTATGVSIGAGVAGSLGDGAEMVTGVGSGVVVESVDGAGVGDGSVAAGPAAITDGESDGDGSVAGGGSLGGGSLGGGSVAGGGSVSGGSLGRGSARSVGGATTATVVWWPTCAYVGVIARAVSPNARIDATAASRR